MQLTNFSPLSPRFGSSMKDRLNASKDAQRAQVDAERATQAQTEEQRLQTEFEQRKSQLTTQLAAPAATLDNGDALNLHDALVAFETAQSESPRPRFGQSGSHLSHFLTYFKKDASGAKAAVSKLVEMGLIDDTRRSIGPKIVGDLYISPLGKLAIEQIQIDSPQG